MLAQLVAGNTDAAAMADLAHAKMRRKQPYLAEALTGHFGAHHALLVGAIRHRLEHVETAPADLDATIVAAMTPWLTNGPICRAARPVSPRRRPRPPPPQALLGDHGGRHRQWTDVRRAAPLRRLMRRDCWGTPCGPSGCDWLAGGYRCVTP